MGIGIVTGTSLNEKIIQDSINYAKSLSKLNTTVKYDLVAPGMKYKQLKLAEKPIVNNPIEFLQDKSNLLLATLTEHKEIEPTFGKFRIYITEKTSP